ncbi:MAG: transglycosylase SLT domain-containing protein [Acidobacteriia bacterium]|nr:transglycosylase SLT domain-containing protein [Terriglobia bacterium]
MSAGVFFCALLVSILAVHARPDPEESSLPILAKQLAVNGSPSVVRALTELARQSSDPETSGLASFALGYYYYQQSDFSSAEEALQNPKLAALPIGDYAAMYLARSRRQLKTFPEALEALTNFSSRFPTTNLRGEADQTYCQILIDQGDPERCLPFLEQRTDFKSSPSSLLLAARSEMEAAHWSSAATLLQRVAYQYPLNTAASDARQELDQLRQEHPSSVPMVPNPIVLSRGDTYFGNKKYQDALSDFESLVKRTEISPSDLAHARLRIGECLLRLNRVREAREALRRAVPMVGEAVPEKLYFMADLQRKLNPPSLEESQRIVSDLEQRFPTSAWTEEAFFSLGNYFLVHQDRPSAAQEYRKIVERFPHGKNAAEALFRVAWTDYLAGNTAAAQSEFLSYIQRYPSFSRTVSAIYWLGRSNEVASPARAAAFYHKVMDDFGESNYALSAKDRLARMPASLQDAVVDLGLPELRAKISLEEGASRDARSRDMEQRGFLFEKIALDDLAIQEFRASLNRGRSLRVATELSRLYTVQSNYGGAMGAIRMVFPDYYHAAMDQLPPEYWRNLFPLPYWSTLRSEAARHGVDPYLIAALIRQESSFNPEAHSPANALGLMQLLPSEARKYARQEHVTRWQRSKVFDPEINIQLGVAYFRDTLDRFNGRVEAALAAYNAGDNRVDVWLSEQASNPESGDPMVFTESIPFTETREYVQIVLRNFNYYRKIYDSSGTARGPGFSN